MRARSRTSASSATANSRTRARYWACGSTGRSATSRSGPVATLLGLAFRLHDPDHLLGEEESLGITLALIPTTTAGVDIGRRHFPLNAAFQNGPNSGKDVFVPLEWVIGGREGIGQGWRMLMESLAAGRSHLAAGAVGGGSEAGGADHRRVCAHPRPVQPADRPVRRRRGSPRAHRRDDLHDGCRALHDRRRDRSGARSPRCPRRSSSTTSPRGSVTC